MIELDLFFEDGTRRRGKFEVPVVMGRASDCGIQVSHWRIARQHLRISRAEDGFHVDDLGSILGTRINGNRITRYGPLKKADEIIVGPCLLRLAAPLVQKAASVVVCNEGTPTELNRLRQQSEQYSSLNDTPNKSQNQRQYEQYAQVQTLRNTQDDIPRDTRGDIHSETVQKDLRQELRAGLIRAFDLRRNDVATLSESALKGQAQACVSELLEKSHAMLSQSERQRVLKLVVDEAIGLGVLEELLEDGTVTEVMVNRFDEIYVEINGMLSKHSLQFSDEQAVRSVIERIVYPLGRRIDEASPMVDARLADGSRLNAVLPPISVRGASLTIRKFPKKRLQMQDLVAQQTLPAALADFLRLCVERRLNILVSGGTGSGKTTLLNILAGFVDPLQRIVTIEDSAELSIQHPHVVTLEARTANSEGQGAVTIRDLVKNALRMRPDRIVVGEVRSVEALDMLAAMNTGHDGSLTTLHANSPRDALSRLETMVLSANVALSLQAIREQIGSALQMVVQQTRLANGRRVITGLAEISGVESGVVQMQQLVRFDAKSQSLVGIGLRPAFFEKLERPPERSMTNWFLRA
ncbi:MAG: secretion protein [Alcaligenaceae bacterium]|nr:MAG: secretion protein [Alcaligenaceae bacterium]